MFKFLRKKENNTSDELYVILVVFSDKVNPDIDFTVEEAVVQCDILTEKKNFSRWCCHANDRKYNLMSMFNILFMELFFCSYSFIRSILKTQTSHKMSVNECWQM